MFSKVLTLLNGKKTNSYTWDIFLFIKRTFNSSEDINIPTDKVLLMHSPSIDSELYIDGEGFIS